MRTILTHEITEHTLKSSAEQLWVYNGLDACVTLEVFEAIEPQLDNQTRATYEFSKSLQGPILEMNMRGVLIDQREVGESLASFERDIATLRENLDYILTESLGIKLNPQSPAQLKHLFYEVMRLPPVRKKNSNGQFTPSVNREALERLKSYFFAQPITN